MVYLLRKLISRNISKAKRDKGLTGLDFNLVRNLIIKILHMYLFCFKNSNLTNFGTSSNLVFSQNFLYPIPDFQISRTEMLNINETNMWRDSSAATSIAKPPNAWGRTQFPGNSGPEVQPGGPGNNTNGGHIPSSNTAASSGGPSRDNRLSFGQMFTPEDMAETVLFGAKGLEDAMERLNIVSRKHSVEMWKFSCRTDFA